MGENLNDTRYILNKGLVTKNGRITTEPFGNYKGNSQNLIEGYIQELNCAPVMIQCSDSDDIIEYTLDQGLREWVTTDSCPAPAPAATPAPAPAPTPAATPAPAPTPIKSESGIHTKWWFWLIIILVIITIYSIMYLNIL